MLKAISRVVVELHTYTSAPGTTTDSNSSFDSSQTDRQPRGGFMEDWGTTLSSKMAAGVTEQCSIICRLEENYRAYSSYNSRSTGYVLSEHDGQSFDFPAKLQSKEIEMLSTTDRPLLFYPLDACCLARVEILLSAVLKHELPVGGECSWHHKRGIGSPDDTVCTRQDNATVQNQVNHGMIGNNDHDLDGKGRSV